MINRTLQYVSCFRDQNNIYEFQIEKSSKLNEVIIFQESDCLKFCVKNNARYVGKTFAVKS